MAAARDGEALTDFLLLSKIEKSDYSNIHSLFSTYLRPFADFTSPKPAKKPSRSKTAAATAKSTTTADVTEIRSLAKRFLTFLNKALTLIPKKLLADLKPEQSEIGELLRIYDLCLKCLEAVVSQLSCKEWFVLAQRARLMHCMEACGKYVEAEEEGISLLGKIGVLDGGGVKKRGVSSRRIVPEVEGGSVDLELAVLVVEIVLTLVKCASLRESRDEVVYTRVIRLVGESRMWFRVLDLDVYERLHRASVTYLNRCTLYLVEGLSRFHGDLVYSFCSMTLAEYRVSSIKEQTFKFARRICYSLFPQMEKGSPITVDILHRILQSIAVELKVGRENSTAEFVDLVSCFSFRCRDASSFLHTSMAACLNDIADSYFQGSTALGSILKTFSIGLPYNRDLVKSMKDQPEITTILEGDGNLRQLHGVLSSFRSLCPNTGLGQQSSSSSACKHHPDVREDIFVESLIFICSPLAEIVNSNRKHILSEEEETNPSTNMCTIQDAFVMLGETSFYCKSHTTEGGVGPEDNSNFILNAAVAALTISFRTKTNSEASEVLHLCCRASWACVSLLCDMVVKKSKTPEYDTLERDVLKFITEACDKSAFYIDLLHQSSSDQVKKEVIYCLQSWSNAWNSLSCVPSPASLVKQWVKVECRLYKDMGANGNAPTLFCLLPSSSMKDKTVSILLEQELVEYEEASSQFSTFCEGMQLKIIDILLNNVYVTKRYSFQRSRILIKKGKLLRTRGVGNLKYSIQSISDAINAMYHPHEKICKWSAEDRNQLAVAYCLRAFSVQEADPSSKQILQDVEAAVNIWLSLPESEIAIPVLYHVLDLLSLKVHMEFHCSLYKLLIKSFKQKNICEERCLSLMWESRRLGHALCASPVNNDFMVHLSETYGEHLKSMEHWLSCLKGSKNLHLGFHQKFSYLFANVSRGSDSDDSLFQPHSTVAKVKEAAKKVTSNGTLTSSTIFLAGHLYYDLSERLVYNGKLIEGLSYAKQAQQLRSKLLEERFTYIIDRKSGQGGSVIEVQQQDYKLRNFQLKSSVAGEYWSLDKVSSDLESYSTSPWNVLQCYLESTLQVGVIHEMLGNSMDAEILFVWGRNICSSLGLAFLTVAFSSVLGKLYRKKKLWSMARNTLENSKNVLSDCMAHITCTNCKLMSEIDLCQQFGDLIRSQCNSCIGDPSSDEVSQAEGLYRTALCKLKPPEWKSSIDCPGQSSKAAFEKASTTIEPKRSRRTKETSANLLPLRNSVAQKNGRVTRSRNQSSKLTKHEDVESGIISCQNDNHGHAGLYAISEILSHLEISDSFPDSQCPVPCFCNNMKCLQHFPVQALDFGLVDNFVSWKWEFVRRRLSIKLLTKIGKCSLASGQTDRAQKMFCDNTTVLFGRIVEEINEDALALERAAFIYNICLQSLKAFHFKNTRSACSEILPIALPTIVSGLKIAFVLCREVPDLFQKVSRLLASLHVLSASTELISFPVSSFKDLSESHWAAYFLQASIGTHLNYQLLSSSAGKSNSDSNVDSQAFVATSAAAERWNILRMAPESVHSLDEFVVNFYEHLPSTTVICFSLLGGTLAGLLNELLGNSSSVNAWVLLSRFIPTDQPIVILLPVDSTISVIRNLFGDDDDEGWHCPWGSTVVDKVVPTFRRLLKENYQSSSNFPGENTSNKRSLWWAKRKELDQSLDDLLREMEDSWFGFWKYLLLGGWSDCKRVDSTVKKLARDLKRKCKLDLNDSLLRLYLGGARYAFEKGESFLELSLKNGCFASTSTSVSDSVESMSASAFQFVLDAAAELQSEPCVRREPTILVLDLDIQMLPLENLPILRTEEVYRMPSVGSIGITLDKSCIRQNQITACAPYPLIDPLDAFYLLNPSGDLSSTQLEFEKWFAEQNLEGKAGDTPSKDELYSALKNHDLFIYFGHGSGAQYIPGHEIQKLESCAATLLMGCSSGALYLNGSYFPRGIPLSYLMAGSPAIIANLWEVTDKDIDRFGKAILDAWLKERSAPDPDPENRPKIGSFISKARDACTLPYLIGAAPVCYGVPTGIWRKKDKQDPELLR